MLRGLPCRLRERGPGLALAVASLWIVGACSSPRTASPPGSAAPGSPTIHFEEPTGREPSEEDQGRPRIGNRPLAIALFPIQLIPDVLANAVVALKPGNLWPIQYLLYPLFVPYWGVTDAWEGRPFWDPSALYE